MIIPNTAGLLLAPMVFFTTVSALAISSTRTPHPQIYSKKLHSARIYEALTTKKNLRTLTETVDAAATPGLADVHPDLAHHALVLDAFATKKPWNTMTIEQDEVVYVTTTRKATSAAVKTGDIDLAAVSPPGTPYAEINTADAHSTPSLHARDQAATVTHETKSEVKTIKHTTTTPVHSTEIKTNVLKHTTTTPVHSTETKTNVLMHSTTTPVHSTVIETKILMHTQTTVAHETKMKIKTVGAKRDAAETQPAQSIEWQVSWSELVGFASAPSAGIHARDAEPDNGGDS